MSEKLTQLPPIPDNGSTLGTEWSLAWANLRSPQHAALLNITTLLAVLGVIVGVAVLNWVVAVMIGFEEDLEEKLIRSDAHVQITNDVAELEAPGAVVDAVRQVPNVVGAAPFVEGEVMLRTFSRSTGVIVKGVDPVAALEVSELPDLLQVGLDGPIETPEASREAFQVLDDLVGPNLPGLEDTKLPAMFIGRTLQQSLLVHPGDTVQLINPVGHTVGLLGMPQPATRMFRVAGVFEAGQYELDAKRVYIGLDAGRAFLQVAGASGIELKVADADALDETVGALRAVVPDGLLVRDWRDLNRALFEALHLQRYVMSVLLSLTIVVAGLLIISTLFMVVITKRGEIAILKAIGAGQPSIRRVFVLHGSFVASIGVVLGSVLGLLGCWALEAYGWPLDADIYAMSTVPVVVEPVNVVMIAVGAAVACFLCTLIPASAAARLDPIEGLRLE